MSVLIKNMGMPKNCGECQLCHIENFNLWCCLTGREDIFYDAMPEWCPLEDLSLLCALADRMCPFQGKEFVWCLTCPHISEEDKALMKKAVAKPKTGEWIDEDGTYYANCSKCGYQMNTHEERGYHNFCPNCGADMRGEDK